MKARQWGRGKSRSVGRSRDNFRAAITHPANELVPATGLIALSRYHAALTSRKCAPAKNAIRTRVKRGLPTPVFCLKEMANGEAPPSRSNSLPPRRHTRSMQVAVAQRGEEL